MHMAIWLLIILGIVLTSVFFVGISSTGHASIKKALVSIIGICFICLGSDANNRYDVRNNTDSLNGTVVSEPDKILGTGMSKVVIEKVSGKKLIAGLVSDSLMVKKGDVVKIVTVCCKSAMGTDRVIVIIK